MYMWMISHMCYVYVNGNQSDGQKFSIYIFYLIYSNIYVIMLLSEVFIIEYCSLDFERSCDSLYSHRIYPAISFIVYIIV